MDRLQLKKIILILICLDILAISADFPADTLSVKAGNYLIIDGVSQTILTDTVIIVSSSAECQIIPIDEKKRRSIKNAIKVKVDSSRWYFEAYDLAYHSLFKRNKTYAALDTGGFRLASEEFLPFAGKSISEIQIKYVDVIEGSIWDTSQTAQSWAAKTINRYHINTRKNFIYRYLSFAVGDKLLPSKIADNERLLRKLSFIEDARIIVNSDENNPENAKLLLILKDRLAFDVRAVVVNDKKRRFFIGHKNIAGYGVEFGNNFIYSDDKSPHSEYDGSLLLNNFIGNRLDLAILYSNRRDYDLKRFVVEKKFLTPATKYAGSIDFINLETYRKTNSEDDPISEKYHINSRDFWLGRSFRIGDFDSRSIWTISGRYYNGNYTERPMVYADTNFFFHDQKLQLFSLGYSKVEYFKSRLIFGYGETEDVPAGLFTNLTIGSDESQFEQKLYAGMALKAADYFYQIGYISAKIEYGGFKRREKIQNQIFNSQVNYYSNLFFLSRFRMRQFIKIDYTKGLKFYTDDRISLAGRNGIRGLSGNNLSGLQRLLIHLESRIFTPWVWFEFRSAFFCFFDLGYIGDGKKYPWRENQYRSIGLGFRLRNESLVFDTFEFRFAYFPRIPSGGSQYRLELNFKIPRVFTVLLQDKPKLIDFN